MTNLELLKNLDSDLAKVIGNRDTHIQIQNILEHYKRIAEEPKEEK